MTTVRVKSRTILNDRQSGVALLQVLLLSAIISLLAIRFTHTARDQISIANQFESRVKAELTAYSAINDIIFVAISESFERRAIGQSSNSEPLINRANLNFYGEPVIVSDGLAVTLQDLNGLLPQIFPGHFLWRRLLQRQSVPDHDIAKYIGVWKDIQDPDIKSWMAGVEEPIEMDNGAPYLNGYAQNKKVIEWVFADRPELIRELQQFSNVDSPFETNLLNSPKFFLQALFDPPMASEISELRGRRSIAKSDMLKLILPSDFPMATMSSYRSNQFRLDVTVSGNGGNWHEKRIVRLSATSIPPFQIILNN